MDVPGLYPAIATRDTVKTFTSNVGTTLTSVMLQELLLSDKLSDVANPERKRLRCCEWVFKRSECSVLVEGPTL